VPVLGDGIPAISAGARLAGKTADAAPARPATGQRAEQPATVRIEFTGMQDDAGHFRPISCVLESIDNARESVDSTGLIIGISVSKTFIARLDQGIKKLGPQFESLSELLGGVKGALMKEADPSIDYRPGVEVTVKMFKSIQWNARAVANLPGITAPATTLARLVNSQPSRTTAESPPKPSDFTNFMFIGTEDNSWPLSTKQDGSPPTASTKDRNSKPRGDHGKSCLQ
jgi:hypothetical protein